MNIKTGIKTLAVAVPMAIAPMKSGAQNVLKQVEKSTVEDGMKLKGSFGAGMGVEPFFNQASLEPKISGSVGFSTYNMNGSVKASIGKSMQTYDVRLAYPINFCNPNLTMNAGGYAKFQHVSGGKDISPIVLKRDLGENNIPLYQGVNSIGLYAEPQYKVSNKLSIGVRAEVGNYNLVEKGIISDRNYILSDDVIKNLKETGMVGNFGVGAQYNINKNISVNGHVDYSTLHKTPGVNVETKLNF